MKHMEYLHVKTLEQLPAMSDFEGSVVLFKG